MKLELVYAVCSKAWNHKSSILVARTPSARIVNMKNLLTVSSWTEENSRAILTQDLSLVNVSKENYTNPRCYMETDRREF